MTPICTTNVEWYESTEKDVCFCIYKLGKHTTFEYRAREDTFREQGENSLEACRTAYKILKRLLPEFLNILNGFVLNLKRIATHIVRNLGANVREEAIGQQQIRDALELTQWDRDHWDFGVEDEDDEEWPFGVMKFSRLGQMINPTDLGLGNQDIKNGLSIYAFRSTGSLRNHYLDQHDQNLEIRRSGGNKRQPQDDLVRWYSLFAGRISHNWSPRKAKEHGFSPELGPRPSLRPLLPTGPPTPLYGPRALGNRATSSGRPHRSPREAEEEEEEEEEEE
ncbi:uncharacterized protein FFB14_02205 [Fusarium fujikuroi]|nr:uncharacterized protein FFB14_02205 [Fusarium fujikuroi]